MATNQYMPGTGWEAVVGIGVEASYGVPVAPTVFFNATAANPSAERTFAKRDPMRRTKGQAQSGPGIVEVKGDITTEVNPSAIGTILGLAFGVDTVSTNAALATPAAPTLTPSTTGGTLPAGTTYNYRISAVNGSGETLPGPEATTAATTTGSTSSIAISWTAVTGAASYNVFGRTTGAELLIANVTGTTYTDTGSITPTGALPVANTTATYSHLFSLNSPLNTFTASVDYFKGTVHQFSGNKIDSLDISAKEKGGLLDCKFGIMGVQDIPLAGSLTPTYASPDRPFFFEDCTSAKINGVTLKATDFSFQMKNNIQPGWFTSSGSFAGQMNETETVITGTLNVQYNDETIFDLLNNLTAAPIVIEFVAPNGDSLTINLPNVLISAAPISLSKKNIMQHAVKFEAFESTPGALNDMTITLVNSASTSYVS